MNDDDRESSIASTNSDMDWTYKDFKKLDVAKRKEIKDKMHIDVYKSHYGFRLIFGGTKTKMKMRWLIGPILFFAIMFSGYVIATYIDGTWIMQGEDYLGFFEDIPMLTLLVAILLILPTLKIFYDRLSSVFWKLFKNDVIDESKYDLKNHSEITDESEKKISGIKVYSEIADESEKFISGNDKNHKYKFLFKNKVGRGSKGLTAFYIIALLLVTYMFVYPLMSPQDLLYTDAWNHRGHWATTTWQLIAMFLVWGYLVPAGLWHFMATIFCVRRIISNLSKANALKLRPLAPDRVAGLKPVGDLTLSMIYIIVVPMITVVTSFLFLKTSVGSYIVVVVYLIVVVVIFFLPLSTAHDVMARAKERELQMLSEEFNRAYDEFKKETGKAGGVTKNQLIAVDYMDKTGALYTHVEKMAVWPFDTSILLKFFIAIILPFILIGTQVLLEWYVL